MMIFPALLKKSRFTNQSIMDFHGSYTVIFLQILATDFPHGRGFQQTGFPPQNRPFSSSCVWGPSWVGGEEGFCKIRSIHSPKLNRFPLNPSKIEWDLTNGPLSKLLAARAIRYSGLGVHSMGLVGSFLD